MIKSKLINFGYLKFNNTNEINTPLLNDLFNKDIVWNGNEINYIFNNYIFREKYEGQNIFKNYSNRDKWGFIHYNNISDYDNDLNVIRDIPYLLDNLKYIKITNEADDNFPLLILSKQSNPQPTNYVSVSGEESSFTNFQGEINFDNIKILRKKFDEFIENEYLMIQNNETLSHFTNEYKLLPMFTDIKRQIKNNQIKLKYSNGFIHDTNVKWKLVENEIFKNDIPSRRVNIGFNDDISFALTKYDNQYYLLETDKIGFTDKSDINNDIFITRFDSDIYVENNNKLFFVEDISGDWNKFTKYDISITKNIFDSQENIVTNNNLQKTYTIKIYDNNDNEKYIEFKNSFKQYFIIDKNEVPGNLNGNIKYDEIESKNYPEHVTETNKTIINGKPEFSENHIFITDISLNKNNSDINTFKNKELIQTDINSLKIDSKQFNINFNGDKLINNVAKGHEFLNYNSHRFFDDYESLFYLYDNFISVTKERIPDSYYNKYYYDLNITGRNTIRFLPYLVTFSNGTETNYVNFQRD